MHLLTYTVLYVVSKNGKSIVSGTGIISKSPTTADCSFGLADPNGSKSMELVDLMNTLAVTTKHSTGGNGSI